MSTAIDSAGRLVIPKALRDAMGLRPGVKVDMSYTDGAIIIEFAPIHAHLDTSGESPRIVPDEDVEPLDDATVRASLESIRR